MITAADTIVLRLDRAMQLRLLAQVDAVIAAAPLFKPVARGGLPMSVEITGAGDLGWIADGRSYRYTRTQADGRPWPPMPREWVEIYQRAAGVRFEPDSAIVNRYKAATKPGESGAKLGRHADRSERDQSLPIVTISLGDPGRWAIWDTNGKASRCVVQSGDVTLLAGPTRELEHAIEGIEDDPMFSPTPGLRTSVTMRVAG